MIKKYIQNFIKYIPLLFLLTTRDFKLKYRRSILGVLWSMLNPLFIMIVVTAVFSVVLRLNLKEIHMPFAVFYITGSLIFNFFSEATSSSMNSIISNASLIQKVYVPKYIFVFEKCMFSLINMLLSSIAVVFVMLYYVVMGEIKIHFTILLIFIPMFFTFVFSVGVGLILATFNVFFRDIVHIWGVVLTMWLYLTPIVYPIEMLRNSHLEWIVRMNPIFYFVDDLRSLMVLGKMPLFSNLVFEALVCFIILIFGLLLFQKTQDKFILHI